MLTDEDWAHIRKYTGEVCNREAEEVVFYAGRVRRTTSGIDIHLDLLQVDLEPLESLESEKGPTSGPGWPE